MSVLDTLAITEVLHRYVRGVDRVVFDESQSTTVDNVLDPTWVASRRSPDDPVFTRKA